MITTFTLNADGGVIKEATDDEEKEFSAIPADTVLATVYEVLCKRDFRPSMDI